MIDISQHILLLIDKNGPRNSLKISEELKESHQKIVGAIKSLESLGNVRTIKLSMVHVYG